MPVPSKLKDRYEIKEMLGKGGMGAVYRAYDTVVKRELALKTILDIADRKALELFHKEYEVLASISHPNIIEIFDIGEFQEEGESVPYFVMPLLRGMTLDKVIRTFSHRLTVERSVEIISQTCRGLQAAHERGLVHRDMKPSNIFVMEDDSVKIIDFGVVHKADVQSTVGMKGTLLYMSPELVQMEPPSALSDIFSLGVVAYETLTQRRPFERPAHHEIIQAILHHIPPPASELNPAVSQSISQVIHKAMAKQPYHRFSSTRELAETLQKALRSEPIEFFDPARIQPRIQRASKAFDQGDYQFADEILSELEAEGHIESAMSTLRRQVDQAIRQKRILQLLESARTRLEEEEYPLALQKVQQALELEPDNAAALSLKSTIESKRVGGKIEDWFRLARQHIDNHAYSHARQALQNVLKLKPKETQALQLLAEVDRLEQEYMRVRQEKEQLYQAALQAWQNGEVSSALLKLEQVLELDRRAPDSSAPARTAAYESFYKQVRSERDAINTSYSEARNYLAGRNFAKAAALCDEYLAKYPGHALFKALKFDVEEQQRQELSAYIAEIDRRVEAEPHLDKRVSILEEALGLYPGETHFERSLQLIREKRDLVNSIVVKARLHEERGQFSDALAQWEILRTIYSPYPGLNFEIDRLVKRRDQQARTEAKARWVERVDRQMEAGDYFRASELLHEAQGEFPNDAELAELEKLVRQGMERLGEALQLMARGQKMCAEGRFEEGLESLQKAYQQDELNPVIRRVLLETLLERARVVLDKDWRSAEALLQQALDLDPGDPLANSLRTLALDHKRAEFLDRCTAQARGLQASGDLEGALAQVQQGLSLYENEPRLTQLHSTLTKELVESQRRQARRRDLEELRRLEREAGAAAEPATGKPISERAQVIARQYPDDQEFRSIAAGIEQRVAAMGVRPREEPREKIEEHPLGPPTPPVEAPEPSAASPRRSTPAAPPEPATVALRGAPPIPQPAVPAVEPPRPEQPPSGPAPAAIPAQAAIEEIPSPPPAKPVVRKAGRRKALRWVLAGAGVVVLAIAAAVLAPLFRMKSPVAVRIPVEVHTSPSGATIRINDRVYGTSDLRLELPAGTYRLEALREGYQPAITTLTVKPETPASVDLPLQALPQIVQIFADLKAGKVWLDEQLVGELREGQFFLESVVPGKHTLRVTGRPAEATIAFEGSPGAAVRIIGPVVAKELKAVLVSSLGSLVRVHSSFGPAKVRLDGQLLGEATSDGLELRNLAPGAHELILGEEKDQRKIIIEIGPAPALTAFLNSDRDVGTLVVVTGEEDVRVLLDGKPYPLTSKRGQLRIPNLEAKGYVVGVLKGGYQSAPQQRVEIRKGEEALLEFRLLPIPTVAALLIQGALPGAQVVVDRNPLGTVQPDGTFSASNLSPGEHTIELRKEQYKPQRVTKHFGVGETVQLGGSEVALETATGTLRLHLWPANSQVMVSRAGEAQARPVGETELTLPEGSYVLVARASNYTQRSVTVQVVAGETRSVDLQLSLEKGAAMAEWEDPSGWVRDGNWFVRRGGNLVLYRITPTVGNFVFTAMLRRGRRLQWVVSQTDAENYLLFQMDRRFFYRNQVVKGTPGQEAKIPHGMDKKKYYTLRTEVSPHSIVHKLYDGENWVLIDTLSDAERTFHKGKFGFLIPGGDEIALSNFTFSPQ